MKYGIAIKNLTSRLNFRAERLKIDDPEQLACDLLEWLNAAEPDGDDLDRLVTLVARGQFESWECPTCDDATRVFEGRPDDWSHFQGVLQNDRVSYPGTGPEDMRCGHCRCHMVGEVL